MKFLEHGSVGLDKPDEAKIRKKALRYVMIEGELYKKSFTLLYLKCLVR